VLIDDVPIGAGLNRNLGNPTAPGEAIEAELNRLIERRSRQKDAEEESALWQVSVRQYNARRREEMRAAWCEHHQGQAVRLRAVLKELIANHEKQAERYGDQLKGA
jgi:type II secretory ATPase GspE/PulE/Tfp pilus assembly ATPase PilB-like protein